VTLALALGACDVIIASPSPRATPESRQEYRPEVVGRIESMTRAEPRTFDVTTSGGGRARINLNSDLALRNSDPDEGDLLFYGTEPRSWFLAVPDYDDPSCYIVEGWATETL
jgi:hypothetical protein